MFLACVVGGMQSSYLIFLNQHLHSYAYEMFDFFALTSRANRPIYPVFWALFLFYPVFL